ncbi:MAG: hypothetical protein H6732_08625 [Alphaproteobacteria bacterium]|nr:hypothetical protein [Alphaproteobacteria bacterium]
MASYVTYLGDTAVLLEAPVSGGLSKSESEVQPNPDKAIANVIEMIKLLAQHVGTEIAPALRRTGAAFEMNFAVRADSQGLVMISEHANVGQFQCALKFPPMRPPGPPARPQPALPQRDPE